MRPLILKPCTNSRRAALSLGCYGISSHSRCSVLLIISCNPWCRAPHQFLPGSTARAEIYLSSFKFNLGLGGNALLGAAAAAFNPDLGRRSLSLSPNLFVLFRGIAGVHALLLLMGLLGRPAPQPEIYRLAQPRVSCFTLARPACLC